MTQHDALEILKMGRNVFLTGPAGSGKTYVLNAYIDFLKKKRVPVAITASTGIAATLMNGTTIHSWAGIGIKDTMTAAEIRVLQRNKHTSSRLQKAKVLIIDEISMLDAQRLDLIELVCRTVRERDESFGGLQVVLAGDFFQLPPIPNRDSLLPTAMAFTAKAWQNADITVCYLEQQYRQNDARYLALLNAIRHQQLDEQRLADLHGRMNQPIVGFAKPTKLYTHNIDVDTINTAELANIQAPTFTYSMFQSGNAAALTALRKNCLAPETLQLKVGALVMFVKNNFEQGFVNGTIGTVVEFDSENAPVIQTTERTIAVLPMSWKIEDDDGSVAAEIKQLPLRLAWAITVHKSQGMSLDCAEIDLRKAFTEGMGYVALSRVRSLAGIRLLGLNAMALRVNAAVAAADTEFKTASAAIAQELAAMNKVSRRKVQKAFLDRVGK